LRSENTVAGYASSMAAGELVCAPEKTRAETPAVDAVRGFVFVSGVRWMEQKGKLEDFSRLLPEKLRTQVRTLSATEWVDIETALEVYATCDALNLSIEDQLDVGRFVVLANNGVVVNTLLRLVGRVGSPWIALEHADSLWRRSNRGGAMAVYRITDKSARIECWNAPMARSRFFVTSMRGSVAAGLEPFCGGRVVVNDVAESVRPDFFALRVTWE
jgi:hypothetical protein